MSDALKLTFKTPIPLVGQVSALEAVDHLYSLMALAHGDWRSDFGGLDNWQALFAELPGKLLDRDSALHVIAMFPGSAVEIVKGLASPVEKLVEFLLLYRQKKQQGQLQQQSDKLKIVREQLLPLIDKLKRHNVPQAKIDRMVAKAYLLIDVVFDGMAQIGDLAIEATEAATATRGRCSKCGQPIAA